MNPPVRVYALAPASALDPTRQATTRPLDSEGESPVNDDTATSPDERPPLPQAGEGFAAKNRSILAARLGWPDGTVEACDDIEAEFPGWHVFFSKPVTTRPATVGFYARHERMPHPTPPLYGETPDALREAIRGQPVPVDWRTAVAVPWR